ncbi:amino acid permease [Apilactobacillus ozensis]|uniref:Amino acid permease-associated protein n=1 Tax=Apilactobacillus ozensis DSM 23829 = JCM 17196 TaxID=1423781 RepID=A0A0R2ANE7_9LACO|nr:amino acid permease [Apilactobacillus ozensis]KRM68407.1 amino acid permease-associated protein [Apilactobacillus ozensis DSM 23829 = JCM 17196]MCK8607676.1 amino acid permease [Apilactobacillus ozensis]
MSEKIDSNDGQMSKGLKNRHVQLIALGGTIGTGLFLGAGQSINFAGPSIVLSYLIAGIACFFLMRALGELLLSDLNCHSYIDFITKYLGEKIGFVAGWTYWGCWITIAMAEITAASLYVHFWFPGIPQWLSGLFFLLVLFLLNSFNVSAFGETEFWFSMIKVVAILALIVVGLILVFIGFKTPMGHASFGNFFGSSFFANGPKGFFLSFQMVIFSFAGIEMIGMTASETHNPNKVIPKAINEVPMRILIFYIGALLVLMFIYPWNHISTQSSPFVQVFESIGIKSAAAIINFVVLTAAVSACNSAVFTTGRMLFSLTYHSKKKFPAKLGTLSKNKIPFNAILFSIVVIAVSLILNKLIPNGVFTFISSVATTCFLLIWGLIIVAHLKYRKITKHNHLENKLTFKMPIYPLSDYFVLAFFLLVAIVMLFKMDTLIALLGSLVWFVILLVIHSMSEKGSN